MKIRQDKLHNPAERAVRRMTDGKRIIRAMGITAAVYFAMRYLLPYVIPFFISYMLVHLLNPAAERMRRTIHVKKEWITAVLLVLLLLLCTMLFYRGYCLLTDQIRKIAEHFDEYYDCFCGMVDGCCLFAEKKFGVQGTQMKELIYSGIDQASEHVRVYFVPGVVNYSVIYLKKIMEAMLFVLMIFVAVILLMKDYDKMHEKLQEYMIYRHVHRITVRMWEKGGMYMRAQGMIILVVIALCAVGLWIMRNPYFLLLGIMIGLLDALPFIGTGTALVPMAIGLFVQKEYVFAAGHVILFVVTYVVREFLEPRLIGSKLGIYPFVMVVIVYAGMYLYGPAGVVLGPVTLLLVMEILREFPADAG